MIKTLKVKNFRRLEDASITFGDPVSWIVGPSGAGKSSILAALEYALSFRNEWTDGKGSGIKNQVKNGREQAEIEITYDEGAIVKRIIPRTKKEPDAIFPEDLARACLCCREIVNMNAKEQKDLFFRYFQPEEQDVFELLNTWDGEFPELGTTFQQFCLDEYNYKEQDIDTLHKIAFESRAIRKKLLEEMVSTDKGLQKAMEPGQEVSVQDIEKVKRAIDAARKKYDDEVVELGKGRQNYLIAMEAWKALEIKRQTAKEHFHEHEKNLRSITNAIGPDVSEELLEQEKKLEKKAAEIKAIQKSIAEISGDTPCPHGRCARVERKSLDDKMEVLTEERDRIADKFRALTKHNNDRIALQKQYKAVSEQWERAKSLYAEAEKIPPAPVEGKVDTKKRDALKVELDKGIAYLEKIQALYTENQTLKKFNEQRNSNLANMHETEIQIAMFESLVKALRPDGIKSKLLARVQDDLENVLEEEAEIYGFRVKVEMEPWGIYFATYTGSGFVLDKFLSKSEKSRVSSCYQKIVAHRSGFPIIGLDGFEIDPIKRRDILNFVLNAGVQSLVFSTSSSVDKDGNIVVPKDLGIEGVKTFFVNEGTITQV